MNILKKKDIYYKSKYNIMTTFKFFPLSTISCNTCVESMDTPTRKNQSDAESTKKCGSCIQFIFMPAFIIIDTIILPIRGIYHCMT